MTTEEMERRWPEVPPYAARVMVIWSDSDKGREVTIDQDTIDEIIEYFEAAREAMND